MSNSQSDPVEILANVLLKATTSYDALHSELSPHVREVADSVMGAICGRSDEGVELRAALGLELTKRTRTGKNLRAAMSAYTDS